MNDTDKRKTLYDEIFNESSAGCNLLIHQGASPFIGKEDLYDFLNIIKKESKNN